MNPIIFHIDINSYFATMLQQENPALRGKAVGVVKSAGRSCIIASSNEAKKLGIKTGCVVNEAKQLCPGIILVPANFDIMLSATRKLKQIFEEFSPQVHVFSLDEAFLDLTGCEAIMSARHPEHGYQPSEGSSTVRFTKAQSQMDFKVLDPSLVAQDDILIAYAARMQARIKAVLGEWVQCNIGISHNKLLAKMAGEIGPKGSIRTIDASNLDSVLSSISFHDVCGVGRALEKKLALLGVSHPMQINLLDDKTLQIYFGPHWAKELRKIGLGMETHFFYSRGDGNPAKATYQKSVGRTITGYSLCDDEREIRRVLLNLLEEATHKLRKMDLSGRKIGISLHGRDQSWGDFKTLKYWVRHTSEIWDLLYGEMYQRWDRTFPIIKFGVWIGDCRPTSVTPQSFLPQWEKQEKIYGIVDKINDRYGSFTLMPATLLGGTVIRPEVTGYLGDKVYLGL